MTLSEVIQTASYDRSSVEAADISQEVLTTIQDEALRKEVYNLVLEDLDEISIREVHYVLDALISVLRGNDNSGNNGNEEAS